MKYEERTGDLFTCPDEYYLAQCISADFAMGKTNYKKSIGN